MEILIGIIVLGVIAFVIGGIDNNRPVSEWSDEKLVRMLGKLKNAASASMSAGQLEKYKEHADKVSEVEAEIIRREKKHQSKPEESLKDELKSTVTVEDEGEVITEKAFAAAKNGELQVQLLIGNAYLMGSYGLPQDFQKAGEYLLMAALQDDAHASLVVSGLYVEGTGLPKDIDKARLWASKAKSLGHPDADDMVRLVDSQS